MAKHKVFVTDTVGKKVNIDSATTYTYDPATKIMKVFWRNSMTTLKNIREGEPISVRCDGSILVARPILRPQKK